MTKLRLQRGFSYCFGIIVKACRDYVSDMPKVPMLCYFALDPTWPDNGTLHPALNATLCKSHVPQTSRFTAGLL